MRAEPLSTSWDVRGVLFSPLVGRGATLVGYPLDNEVRPAAQADLGASFRLSTNRYAVTVVLLYGLLLRAYRLDVLVAEAGYKNGGRRQDLTNADLEGCPCLSQVYQRSHQTWFSYRIFGGIANEWQGSCGNEDPGSDQELTLLT